MRCLTCGKRVNLQMKECSNCGAMVPQPEKSAASASSPAGEFAGKEFDWKSVLAPRQAAAPAAERREPVKPQTFSAPPSEPADEESEPDTRPAAPPAPAWTRFVFPAIIILWFAFRTFAPEIKRFLGDVDEPGRDVPAESASGAPELGRIVLCERVEQGQPVGERNRFSKSKDKLATVFTVWSGSGDAAPVQINWRSPKGSLLAGSQKVIQLSPAGSFAVVGELPLGEFSEPGAWSVDVALKGETLASSDFTVEP